MPRVTLRDLCVCYKVLQTLATVNIKTSLESVGGMALEDIDYVFTEDEGRTWWYVCHYGQLQQWPEDVAPMLPFPGAVTRVSGSADAKGRPFVTFHTRDSQVDVESSSHLSKQWSPAEFFEKKRKEVARENEDERREIEVKKVTKWAKKALKAKDRNPAKPRTESERRRFEERLQLLRRDPELMEAILGPVVDKFFRDLPSDYEFF